MTHRQYIKLAIPLILSGISVPLLGAVDTAVAGRLEHPAYIGGIAVGSLIFNILYWLFGFLRVSTTGFTAQAAGAQQDHELANACFRPMMIALLIGLLFIAAQQPILLASLHFIGGSQSVMEQAAIYFEIRIWGAPFALMNYVITGWLMGMSMVKFTLLSQLLVNVLNMLLSILFALQLDWGVSGIAAATLISEVSGVLIGLAIMWYSKKISVSDFQLRGLLQLKHMKKMVAVNRDLFLRTICLLAMTSLFTAQGARMNETMLAGNAILLQLHYLLAYLFSGLANASSIIAGEAVGERSLHRYRRAITLSAVWGAVFALLLAVLLICFSDRLIALFSANAEIQQVANDYLFWIVLYCLAGAWGLQLEGIFSGATQVWAIRNGIFMSLLIYICVNWFAVLQWDNHGLWLAFVVFHLMRSLCTSLYMRKVERLLY